MDQIFEILISLFVSDVVIVASLTILLFVED
jgi:hypothetical protein